MADRFWKSMPAALILQLEAQGECRESATEAALMNGYTSEGISHQEQTRWLSWNVDIGVRGFDLARIPRKRNTTEYGAEKSNFPPTQPHGLDHGATGEKGLLP